MNQLVIRSEDDQVITSLQDELGLVKITQANTKGGKGIILTKYEATRVVTWLTKWLEEQKEEPK